MPVWALATAPHGVHSTADLLNLTVGAADLAMVSVCRAQCCHTFNDVKLRDVVVCGIASCCEFRPARTLASLVATALSTNDIDVVN
jgi:hypothetical protein